MRYLQMQGTDLVPSVICLGGGPLCVEDDEAHVFSLLDTYYQLGGNFIDSANIYGKWLPSGRNICDENIGAWLELRGLRSKIIVTTKVGHPHLASMGISRLSKAETASDLEESLHALRCETVDLLYLHRDDESIPVSYIIDYLNEFVKQGKIRYFGVSNWRMSRIQAAQAYAEETGQQAITANQVMWSYPLFDMTKSNFPDLVWLDKSAREYHASESISVVTYQSQARGYFSKLASAAESLTPSIQEQYYSQENLLRYQRATILAENLGVNVNAVALAYVINQPFPAYAIIGSHTEYQIGDSMHAADIRLTPEQIRFLEEG
jgi:aryl-alcohol dehydrogenase-like predicted oxidoreductase